jgi:alpha-tubulin suppressor-like RCC1 family protein
MGGDGAMRFGTPETIRVWARSALLLAAAALVAGAIWATEASSAAPSAGQVLSFGSGSAGQLGPGRPTADPDAAAVNLPSPAVAVAAGGDHTLAVGTDGSLVAFGGNFFGELGNNTNTGTETTNPTPTAVTLPESSGSVVQAAAGYNFSAALTSSGQLYEFGDNTAGELARDTNSGTDNPNPTPMAVTLPGDTAPITQVVAGGAFVVARTSDDHLWSWGDNTDGQLGTPGNSGAMVNPTPADITFTPVGHFVGLAAGANHALALTSSGQVFSWGNDQNGQLGRDPSENPPFTTDEYPQQITFPPSAGAMVAIAAGGNHSLALDANGALYAWGDNNYGQLGTTTNNGGDGPNQTPGLVPMPAGAGSIVQISAGADDTLVLTSAGRLYTFGDNSSGQLGTDAHTGQNVANPTPTVVPVPNDTTLDGVASGPAASHTLALVAALAVAADLPGGTTGAAYSAQVQASGGVGPYRWSASALAPGLSMNASGAITGTPTAAGDYTPQVTVTDSHGVTVRAAVTLTITAPGTTTAPPPSTTSTTSTTTTAPPPASTTSTTTTGPSAPPVPRHVSVRPVATDGASVTLAVQCAGVGGQQCAGTVTGTTVEHLVGGKLSSVTSAATPAARKPKNTTRRITVVSTGYAVAAGTTKQIVVSLSTAGRALLDRFYRVPVSLSIADGASASTRDVTFHYTIINAPVDYYWKYTRSYTFIGHLLAEKLPSSWHVTLSCHGGGCPLKHAAVTIHDGTATATPALKGAHLRTGAVVQLTVSARNAVAEVLRFQMLSNQLPRTTALCQTPDRRAPGACHATS